jgi:hypothetical protein
MQLSFPTIDHPPAFSGTTPLLESLDAAATLIGCGDMLNAARGKTRA